MTEGLRKYEGWVNKDGGGYINPKHAIRLSDERATAIDQRDVEPLLDTVRELIKACDRYADGASFRRVREAQAQANQALAPFTQKASNQAQGDEG